MTHVVRRTVVPPRVYVDRRTKGEYRPVKGAVDFAQMPDHQLRVHVRLENWGRWCRGPKRPNSVIHAPPMFNLYRSSEARREYNAPIANQVDAQDATRIAVVVGALEQGYRLVLHWYYLKPRSPAAKARELGVTLERLAVLVIEARDCVINQLERP